MTLPANIRVNTSAPFPATVKGSGAIGVGKVGGVWTIFLNYLGFGTAPTVPDPANTYTLVWNKLTGVFTLIPIGSVFSSKVVTKLGGVGQPASPYAAQPTDDILLVYAVPFTVNVNWSARVNPLRIVDQSGAASVATPITITPSAGQTQMATVNYSYPIDGNGGSITLTPLPDGTGAY